MAAARSTSLPNGGRTKLLRSIAEVDPNWGDAHGSAVAGSVHSALSIGHAAAKTLQRCPRVLAATAQHPRIDQSSESVRHVLRVEALPGDQRVEHGESHLRVIGVPTTKPVARLRFRLVSGWPDGHLKEAIDLTVALVDLRRAHALDRCTHGITEGQSHEAPAGVVKELGIHCGLLLGVVLPNLATECVTTGSVRR
jgi:hypothetical protein